MYEVLFVAVMLFETSGELLIALVNSLTISSTVQLLDIIKKGFSFITISKASHCSGFFGVNLTS